MATAIITCDSTLAPRNWWASKRGTRRVCWREAWILIETASLQNKSKVLRLIGDTVNNYCASSTAFLASQHGQSQSPGYYSTVLQPNAQSHRQKSPKHRPKTQGPIFLGHWTRTLQTFEGATHQLACRWQRVYSFIFFILINIMKCFSC